MAESVVEPEGNRLLARLPPEELERLTPHLGRVSLALGEVIYESGGRQSYIYFPTNAIISLLYLMENGSSAEMGVAGKEGLVGVALFMGGDTVPNRAVVQSAGGALRMKTKVLQDEFARGGVFQRLLLRYTQALMTQMSQTAVCNRLHTIEQQLCRWLLLSHDRLDSDELVMTQELIANMLALSFFPLQLRAAIATEFLSVSSPHIVLGEPRLQRGRHIFLIQMRKHLRMPFRRM